MKFIFLKEKALFMSFIIIVSTIYISLSFQDVSAQSNQQACCEVTKSGDYCVYTDKNNCDINNKHQTSPYRCEDSFFCVNICCVDQIQCSSNTPKSICQSRTDSKIYSDNTCFSVNECGLGCCDVGNDKRFISEIKCKSLANNFFGTNNYNLNNVFKKVSVNECFSGSQEEGCCIDNGICSSGNKINCGGDFKSGKICSELDECKKCEKHSYKDCKDGNVYWYDSCGNYEELIKECNKDNELCVKENNDVFCKNLDCPITTKYPGLDYTGKSREHGESWCVYESPTGNFLDKPGSSQY